MRPFSIYFMALFIATLLITITADSYNSSTDNSSMSEVVIENAIIQRNLNNLTNLSDDKSVDGHLNKESIVKVYGIHLPNKGLHSFNQLYINLHKISESGHINLDTYYTNLTKLGSKYSLSLENDDEEPVREIINKNKFLT